MVDQGEGHRHPHREERRQDDPQGKTRATAATISTTPMGGRTRATTATPTGRTRATATATPTGKRTTTTGRRRRHTTTDAAKKR